jgi:hypothetical protein
LFNIRQQLSLDQRSIKIKRMLCGRTILGLVTAAGN